MAACVARARACGSNSRDEGDSPPPPPVCVPAQDPIEQTLTPRDDVGANKRDNERDIRERENDCRKRTREMNEETEKGNRTECKRKEIGERDE